MRQARTRALSAAAVAFALLAAAACTQAKGEAQGPGGTGAVGTTGPAPGEPQGIEAIDHVIIVVQENRSFDHYFGTYPGADGIPRTDGSWDVCIPDPKPGRCASPYHSTGFFDAGGGHTQEASSRDVNDGRMNGFVRTVRRSGGPCESHPNDWRCKRMRVGPHGQPDVMGFHTRAELPNYWAYADRYVLQDRMFAPADSWTLPAHLFLV